MKLRVVMFAAAIASFVVVLSLGACVQISKAPPAPAAVTPSAVAVAPPVGESAPPAVVTAPAPVVAAKPPAVVPKPAPAPALTPVPVPKPAPAIAAKAPAPVKPAGPPPLDLTTLESRLRATAAIGAFTKLSIKNQVSDLLDQFKTFHSGGAPALPVMRQKYDLLLMKVLTLLQDDDAALAGAISASRESIWGILVDPAKFAKLS